MSKVDLYHFPDWERDTRFERTRQRLRVTTPELLGNLILLWRWYIERNGNGSLRSYFRDCRWEPKPRHFLARLKEAGYIQQKKNGALVLMAADPVLEKNRLRKLTRNRARKRRVFRT